ncbi:Hypothetical protein R9X50_00294700 [Acrodontium crateriforme]|uniref:Actin binding protein n=1 Tax=Acrodontium crateriforme TaxID=150365 RepID=A0AAQ3M1Z2_9PEZI|nr:Hypothetical protein R9X50_00294700 [Acrodontium crateriforme]
MASLNTSANGPSISASYQKVVNSPPPTGAAASSPTYAQWALFSVQAPLVNAFQQDAGKESVLKVQTTGEGELIDLIDEFSDGRIQFAFVKVTDPNTRLPKSVLIAWCGEGVPERTKGYFTSHLNAISKILHGYHVQVTARSDRDLTPDSIVQKVQDSSGSKYGGGSSNPSSAPSSRPPPVAAKPIMPTKSFGTNSSFQPLGARTRQAPAPAGPTDNDGWGVDAPQVTRSQLEKVESAYKPTKVDMGTLQSQKEPSRYQAPEPSNGNPDVVRGGYQPIGKVDISAIRKQAQEQSQLADDRPTVVKGAYEPIGKVDIAEIRRKAQGAPSPAPAPAPAPVQDEDDRPRHVAERMAAFNPDSTGGRLTSLPKPQIAKSFGTSTTSFAGTKAPAPGGFEAKTIAAAAPVGVASRSFADQGGKTPAQLWEEKKRARGGSNAVEAQHSGGTPASPITSQQSGGWQSSYGGKKWDVQIPSRTGGSAISDQKTGGADEPVQEDSDIPAGNVGSIRDRFKNAAPMGATREQDDSAPPPPPLDTSSKPNAGVRGVPMPGLPQRPQAGVPSEQHQDLPPPPPRPQPEEEDEEQEEDYEPQGSPARIAMPVSRNAAPEPIEPAEALPPPPMPVRSLATAAAENHESHLEAEPLTTQDEPGRGAAQAAAASTFGNTAPPPPAPAAASGGKTAVAQYDYEKAEDNELALAEGERVTNIDMVDEDWWMGQNERGETGLFPSNYVELVEDDAPAAASSSAAVPPSPAPAPAAAPAAAGSKTATAQYDYEAAEDNELSFPDGATITNIEFPDDDWWFGHFNGKEGLFPANYVTLDE